jgi:hypothetical protein
MHFHILSLMNLLHVWRWCGASHSPACFFPTVPHEPSHVRSSHPICHRRQQDAYKVCCFWHLTACVERFISLFACASSAFVVGDAGVGFGDGGAVMGVCLLGFAHGVLGKVQIGEIGDWELLLVIRMGSEGEGWVWLIAI